MGNLISCGCKANGSLDDTQQCEEVFSSPGRNGRAVDVMSWNSCIVPDSPCQKYRRQDLQDFAVGSSSQPREQDMKMPTNEGQVEHTKTAILWSRLQHLFDAYFTFNTSN